MNKKYLAALFFALLACAVPGFSDDFSSHPNWEQKAQHWQKENAERYLDSLKQNLQLSEDQTLKVRAILSAGWEEMKTARKTEKDQMRPPDRMRRWAGIKVETDLKIKAILTSEQRKKFETFEADQKLKRTQGIKTRVLRHLSKEVQLTDEQKVKVLPILDQFFSNLGVELEKPAESKEAIQALRKTRDDQIAAILTPEQNEKFAKIRFRDEQRWQKRH